MSCAAGGRLRKANRSMPSPTRGNDTEGREDGDTMATNLCAGVARVTITPSIGIPMIGFAGRGPAAGLHDDLTATALVLEGLPVPLADDPPDDGITRLAIIACDLLFLRAEEVHAVREAVGRGRGKGRWGTTRRERTASGQIILGQNPSGPVDPRMAVLRVDGTNGRPLAAVLNYTCHPVSLGSQCTDISADFPGTARRLVEEQTGATCLFLQGAAGNVNPFLMGWDWTHLARLGLPLGAEAVRVYWSSTPSAEATSGGLRVARSHLDLPPLLPASIAEGREMVAALEAERDRLREAGDPGALWWTELRLERTRTGLDALHGGATVPPVQAALAVLRLGHAIGLVTAPGEIFTEIGQSIVSRSPFRHTLYAGYTDGTIGYVPTRAAYAEGGYEVTHACRVAPEAGEQIEDESMRLLTRVHGAT